MTLAWVLAISAALQFTAAAITGRIALLSGWRTAWSLISAAFGLVALRQVLSFARYVAGSQQFSPDLLTESMTLVVSFLMVIGLRAVLPLVLRIRLSEKSLEESEEQYREIFEATTDGLIVIAKDGSPVEANSAFCRMHGYSKDELLQLKPHDFIHPDSHGQFQEFVSAVTARRPFHCEAIDVRKDGSCFDVEVDGIPFSYQGQAHLLGRVRDISERKRSESDRIYSLRSTHRHQEALVTLANHPAIISGELEEAAQVITETAAEAIDVERVSLWFFNDDRSTLRCINLFERSSGQHSDGTILEAADYPHYFEALNSDRAIDANDAKHDPRTEEFRQGYLEPRGIMAMLDSAGRVSGQVVGIICNEHVGGPRQWTEAETTFAGEIADTVVQVLMSRQKQRAEQALRENELMLRQIIDVVPHGIFAKDREGRFILANRAVAEVYGTTVEDLVAGPNGVARKPVSEPAQFLKDDRAVIDSGLTKFIPEEKFVDASGRTRILQTTKMPFTLAGMKTQSVLGVSVDITELKNAKDLQEARGKVLERLATGASLEEVLTVLIKVAEQLRPGLLGSVLLLDEQDGCLKHGIAPSLPDFYNEAVDGLRIGDGMGSCGTAAFTGERVIVSDVMSHPYWSDFRDLAARANLRACWSQPIVSSTGTILGTFAIYYRHPKTPDVWDLEYIKSAAHLAGIAIERKLTEQDKRNAQRQLIEHQREEKARVETELIKVRDKLVKSTRMATIGRMSAQVAHDIRNPLGSIRNAAYYLKRKVPATEPKWRDYLELIDSEVDVCNRIIEGLLDVTWNKEPIRELVDLSAMVDDAFSRVSLPREVTVRQSYAEKPFLISVDPVRFRRVLDNLIRNAAEAVDEQGDIEVQASRNDRNETIEIRNSGSPIPTDERESIFELFYTTKAKGTGLGLPICRQFVERHGGSIVAVDENSHGATFRIELPRSEQN